MDIPFNFSWECKAWFCEDVKKARDFLEYDAYEFDITDKAKEVTLYFI